MSAATRQMHLGVFVLGAGNHSAGWRWEGAAVSNNDLAVIQEIARIAERGKFDLLFVSDGLDYEQGDLPSFMCRFEPTSLISVLSAHTTRLGLGATVSTSFTEPYNVARLFASIDHISQGRAAWNVVTSSRPKAALNFNFDRQMDHELRYQRAEEFVDAARLVGDQRPVFPAIPQPLDQRPARARLRSAAGGLNAIAMGYRAAVLQVRIHLPSSGESANHRFRWDRASTRFRAPS